MTTIDANGLDFQKIGEQMRSTDGDITLMNCLGQRFIAAGRRAGTVIINGMPGNALGAYLDGADIVVNGNAQDAVGDTMNDGGIVIHGSVGDAAGYAMRGGEIYIKDNAGYRAGIHMKAYADKLPVMVVGGRCGAFLGEYQAGGVIVVLGQNGAMPIVGNYCGTGMHGGRIVLRCDNLDGVRLPKQVRAEKAGNEDMDGVKKYIEKYCALFGADFFSLYNSTYYVLTPNSADPYKQLYVQN